MESHGKLIEDVLEKLYHFCAYQERCKQDVKKKLNKLEIPIKHQAWYIAHLEEQRFLDEARYVDYFVKSRTSGNQWGARKIAFALKQKGIPDELIQSGLEQLSEEDTYNRIYTLAKKKYRSVKGKNAWEKQQKVFSFLLQKGFEYDIVKQVIQKVIAD